MKKIVTLITFLVFSVQLVAKEGMWIPMLLNNNIAEMQAMCCEAALFEARGELIGLNFDRIWEGTMSDVNFDANICRNIMVDSRYVLFIIDKFAEQHWLIDEMELVTD